MDQTRATAAASEPSEVQVQSGHWLIGRRWDRMILAGCVLGYLGTYFAYYPRIYDSEDDASYLGQAYALRHGHITLDSLHQAVVQSFMVGHHLVSQYPPGMPALLALVSFGGWTSALGTNLLVVLATCGVVAYLLRRHRLPIVFCALYLLYPTAVLFSHTVMADLLSGLIVAAAVAMLLDDRPVLTGLLLGAGVLVRDANVLACATVPAGYLFDLWRAERAERRSHSPASQPDRHALGWVARYAVGLIPAAVLVVVVYFVVDGGKSYSATGHFALHYLPQHLPLTLLGLALMYPLMLIAPLVFRSPVRTPVLLTCYGFLLLYGAWFFQNQGTSSLQTLVLSQRFMLVVLPLFVVTYAYAICELARRVHWARFRASAIGTVAGLLALFLIGSSVAIQRTVQNRAETLVNVRTALLRAVAPSDLLVCDKEVGKLLLPQWGHRDVFIVDTQSSVAVVSYIKAWESQPGVAGRRTLVADWSGGGIQKSRGEASAVAAVQSSLATSRLAPETLGLPANFKLFAVAPS